jgi:hypothetical protein
MKKNKNDVDTNTTNMLRIRLDAIILLLITFSNSNAKLGISDIAPILHKAGYTPTEIAKLFGKEKPQEIAPYLYRNKKNKAAKKNISEEV